MSATIVKITFSPASSPEERRDHDYAAINAAQGAKWSAAPDTNPQSCFCSGPRPGETKCPCALRAESERGAAMIRDGVVIDGIEYELVRKRKIV